MSSFRFANPAWIHALWPVAFLVVLLFWSDWRRGDLLSRLVSSTMQPRLVERLPRIRRWLSIVLFGLAALSVVVALMRPQWGLVYRETPRVGAQIMVCLDVSRSMLAEDTAPNRLERAKAELADLMTYLQGDQVGLTVFAGRAAVLCPLTPDFGFFRLILDNAGPDSVGRGGTRLEEPIRKALDGFRTESDVSRIIVLITDGEDHDSHPLDAAKAAAERGIKILTIGFGDEAGSRIQYTDPQTGAPVIVRDANGAPVLSRLDGETLRQIALQTDGAYIPAGTGALDLKSIYDAHIAPLVRGRQDTRGHAVRREAFQWAILAALVSFVASVTVGSRSVASQIHLSASEPVSPSSRLGAAALLVALGAAGAAQAQQPGPPPAAPVAAEPAGSSGPTQQKLSAEVQGRDARDLYNDALVDLGKDPDRAEQFLAEARRQSGTDGEVRFRATYNLGWVEVTRADSLLEKKPEEALSHLRRAADWFRDAVRLRPDRQDARYNLEVVLRRIVQLADSLAKTADGDLAARRDGLVAQQRSLVAAARQVVERVAAADDPNAADRFEGDFHQLAVVQRTLLSDCQTLSASAREELDALNSKAAEQKSPEESLRAAQLDGVLQYTGRAEQRMGQARSQMRLRQADRTFRRASIALDELKRARDQLRGPVEVLDVIIADAASLAQLTTARDTAARPALSAGSPVAEAPSWLSPEYLDESQLSVTERVSELATRLQAALDEQASRPAGPPTPDQQRQNAGAERFVAAIRDAMPLLNRGKEAFGSAGRALAGRQFDEAARQQREAIAALRDARERFLELRGLIELAYAGEVRIEGLLAGLQASGPPITQPGPPASASQKDGEPAQVGKTDESGAQPAPPAEAGQENVEPAQAGESDPEDSKPVSPADGNQGIAKPVQVPTAEEQIAVLRVAAVLQSGNLERTRRIAQLIDTALADLPDPPGTASANANGSGQEPAAEQAEAQREQLELAAQLARLVQERMSAASEAMAKAAGSRDTERNKSDAPVPAAAVDAEALERSREEVSQAVEQLQALRRLFFSIIEHLQETAQRQAELNDQTEQVAALPKEQRLPARTGPLSTRQEELRKIAGEIAGALAEQAKKQPAADVPGQQIDPKQLAQLQQNQEQFGKAAKLVGQAGTDMESAQKDLAFEEPIVDQARKHQDLALEALTQALALLQPPPPEDQDGQNEEQQQDQPQQEQQPGQDRKPQEQKPEMGTDPARLLQAIRDREAHRNRERDRHTRVEQEPVEKDW
ncbi:MAG: vWA domain-containing protein [Thermoguttaceae bacterium]